MVHLIAFIMHLANTIIPWIVGAEIIGKGFLEGVELLGTMSKWLKKNKTVSGFALTNTLVKLPNHKRKLVKVKTPVSKTVEKKYVKEEARHKKSETVEESKHKRREMEDFKEIEKFAE